MQFFVPGDHCLGHYIRKAGIHNKKNEELLENLFEFLPQPLLEHSWRVSEGCNKLAKILFADLYQDEPDVIQSAGFLHDIGKLFINSTILDKPGRLSFSEYAIAQQHTLIGHTMLLIFGAKKEVAEALLYHHENNDGTGYPMGLSGKQIPKLARLIHILDVFDALTSNRPYRKAYSSSEALEIMRKESTNFDPDFMYVFTHFVMKASTDVHAKDITNQRNHAIGSPVE